MTALAAGGVLLALSLLTGALLAATLARRPAETPAARAARRARRRAAIVEALKSLPLIAFALMLGGGLVATAFVLWGTLDLAPQRWMRSEAVQLALIRALSWQSLAWIGVVAIVMVALAWGKPKSFSVTLPGGASVSAEIEDDEAERSSSEAEAER